MTHKQTILIIEADPQLQDMREILEYEGFQIVTAKTTIDGIALTQQHRPGLILCAHKTPEISAIDFMSALRLNRHTEHIPVTLLLRFSQPDQKDLPRILYPEDWLVKPFTRAELLNAINRCLPRPVTIRAD